MTGDASLFARADEIELSWQVIDPIQAGWDQELKGAQASPVADDWSIEVAPPLEFYEQGSWGPPGAERLLAVSGRSPGTHVGAGSGWRLGCYRDTRNG
jgi:glucose-6-phosphate 1-dehydrogenase